MIRPDQAELLSLMTKYQKLALLLPCDDRDFETLLLAELQKLRDEMVEALAEHERQEWQQYWQQQRLAG